MRHKNGSWKLPPEGTDLKWDQVLVAVMMDVRDELQQLNRVLGCHNFLAVPSVLRDIRRNTTRRKRKPALKLTKSA